jgi:hypothetical protein
LKSCSYEPHSRLLPYFQGSLSEKNSSLLVHILVTRPSQEPLLTLMSYFSICSLFCSFSLLTVGKKYVIHFLLFQLGVNDIFKYLLQYSLCILFAKTKTVYVYDHLECDIIPRQSLLSLTGCWTGIQWQIVL